MQQLTAFIFSLALWLFLPFNADACSCGPCESVDDARRHYGIFLHLAQAEILASYPIPNDGHHDETKIELAPIRQLIVKPVKRYRGPDKGWLLIHDEGCGLTGDVGDEILIAVHKKADGKLYSSPCAVSCALDLNCLRFEQVE